MLNYYNLLEMLKCYVALVVFFVTFCSVGCANILVVMPLPISTHQVTLRALWDELSKRHQVTLITTNPSNDLSLTNLTEIDISFAHKLMTTIRFHDSILGSSSIELFYLMEYVLENVFSSIMASHQVQTLLNSNKSYDLVIFEALHGFPMGFAWKYQCPFIGITSLDVSVQFHNAIGNPPHPLLFPNYNIAIEDPEDMSFFQRFTIIFITLVYYYFVYHRIYYEEDRLLKLHLDANVPKCEEMEKNISLILSNVNFFYGYSRPRTQTTIDIGGIHLEEPKQLPMVCILLNLLVVDRY